MDDLTIYNSSTELSFINVTEELIMYVSSDNLSFILEENYE